jgi:hypothetical protein
VNLWAIRLQTIHEHRGVQGNPFPQFINIKIEIKITPLSPKIDSKHMYLNQTEPHYPSPIKQIINSCTHTNH